jgi:hypothetical protein
LRGWVGERVLWATRRKQEAFHTPCVDRVLYNCAIHKESVLPPTETPWLREWWKSGGNLDVGIADEGDWYVNVQTQKWQVP